MRKSFNYSPTTGITPHIIQDELSEEPVIKLVDQIIKSAIEQEVSDIHIEPLSNTCRVRYRRDGILTEASSIPSHLASRFITRLKVMAQLDITERRLPQDGRLQLDHIDIRINTCPTLFGEKIVLRLLNANQISLDIDSLGFNLAQKQMFLNYISKPQGMVLVTGPTGSGKTVTLYAALSYLNSIEKNISTVEDPIEIQLTGINQININPKIGLEFATVLRTLLRQDPDIIMLGEIRDQETASIAVQAAQTGHLVLATLHTNNALETLARLQSIGVSLYDMVSTLSLIVSQRLVRVLCSACKKSDSDNNFHSVGCPRCLQGYKGRRGIYEFFPVTEKIGELILAADMAGVRQHVRDKGFVSLYEAGLELVQRGITSLSELKRVVSI